MININQRAQGEINRKGLVTRWCYNGDQKKFEAQPPRAKTPGP